MIVGIEQWLEKNKYNLRRNPTVKFWLLRPTRGSGVEASDVEDSVEEEEEQQQQQ
jgi:hypothetical protein